MAGARITVLRQFATERFVFHDQIADLTVVGEEMPNLGFKPGDRVSMRLVHYPDGPHYGQW